MHMLRLGAVTALLVLAGCTTGTGGSGAASSSSSSSSSSGAPSSSGSEMPSSSSLAGSSRVSSSSRAGSSSAASSSSSSSAGTSSSSLGPVSTMDCSPATSGDPGIPPSEREAIRAFYARSIEHLCAFEERCAAERGRAWSTRARCERQVENLADGYLAFYGIDLFAVLAASFVLGPQAAQDACVNELDALACDAFVPTTTAACEQAVLPRSGSGEGVPCSLDLHAYQPCERGLVCRSDGTGCSTCVARWANGAACSEDDDCATRYCDPATGRCADPPVFAAAGAMCTPSSPCLGNLKCVPRTDGTALCRALALPGETCASPDGSGPSACVGDAVCRFMQDGPSRCIGAHDDGEACSRNPPVGDPGCFNTCNFPSVDAPTGTCGPVTGTVEEGDPCSRGSDYATCTRPDLYPDEEFMMVGNDLVATACTCRARRGDCVPCASPIECASRLCFRSLSAGIDLCMPKRDDGERCSSSDECASNHCVGGFCTTGSACN